MTRSALIILFGAIPASVLSWFAGLAIMVSISGLFSGQIGALFFGLWGAAGIYGTIALWVAALGPSTKFVYLGLLFGSIAVFPLVLATEIRTEAEGLLNNFAAVASTSTFLVALGLFVELVVRTRSFSRTRKAIGD